MKRGLASGLIAAGIALLATAVYAQTLGFDFINYDDPRFVSENLQIARGLSFETVRWSLTTGDFDSWIPLTIWSYLLDVELYGIDATGFHLTNLVLHLINAVLLFAVLAKLTRTRWPSALAAAVFAVHPIHVESVAWVAERKGLLSATAWLGALWLYADYSARRTAAAYCAVAGALVLSLMAKPMAVTLPFVFLLLDAWPLGRCRAERTRSLLIEKLPFFAFVAAVCVATLVIERSAGAMEFVEQRSIATRTANALVAYTGYLKNVFWPFSLAAHYPHREADFSLLHVLFSGLALLALTAMAVHQRSRRPHLLIGWLWFLGTLVPVIGLVPVGQQAMADRYAYLPCIGIYIAAAWEVAALRERFGSQSIALAGLSFGVIVLLAFRAHDQASHWRTSRMLFEHSLEVTERNARAHIQLGAVALAEGEYEDSLGQYEAAIAIAPTSANALAGAGLSLHRLGRSAEAEASLRRAFEIDPSRAKVASGLSIVLRALGKSDEAITLMEGALSRDPTNRLARTNLANSYLSAGRPEAAIAQYRTILAQSPSDGATLIRLGVAHLKLGQFQAAILALEQGVTILPQHAGGHSNLALAYAGAGRIAEAREQCREALKIDPGLHAVQQLLDELEKVD